MYLMTTNNNFFCWQILGNNPWTNNAGTPENYTPYHNIPIQFSRYSYIRYNKRLVRGFIHNVSDELQSSLNNNICSVVPSVITNLCVKYYFINDDVMYQLAFQIYSILEQLNRRSVNMKILKLKRHPTIFIINNESVHAFTYWEYLWHIGNLCIQQWNLQHQTHQKH